MFQGFRVEAIWGRTNEEAAATAFSLDIPFATNRIDDVLLRKDVDLILILCSPLHHSQIAVKALGQWFLTFFCPTDPKNFKADPSTIQLTSCGPPDPWKEAIFSIILHFYDPATLH